MATASIVLSLRALPIRSSQSRRVMYSVGPNSAICGGASSTAPLRRRWAMRNSFFAAGFFAGLLFPASFPAAPSGAARVAASRSAMRVKRLIVDLP